MLFEHIQKPEFVALAGPQPIAFWDNRVTQHYAVNDYPPQRIMNRATVRRRPAYHRRRPDERRRSGPPR